MVRISNRTINDLLIQRLRTGTLIGTWVEMEDIPKALIEGNDVVLISPNRAGMAIQVDELTRLMRRNKVSYRHEPWIKGTSSTAIAVKITCLQNDKICYCVSEENLNVMKQLMVDKHCRVF